MVLLVVCNSLFVVKNYIIIIIGTSNWSADYFINTGGASIVIQRHNSSEIVDNLNEKIFMRDWNSTYASPLSDFDDKGHRIINDTVVSAE